MGVYRLIVSFECSFHSPKSLFPHATLMMRSLMIDRWPIVFAELPLVLIVKSPWDPQFQRAWGSFCSAGSLCLFTKIFGTFFLRPGRTHFAINLYVLFIFVRIKRTPVH